MKWLYSQKSDVTEPKGEMNVIRWSVVLGATNQVIRSKLELVTRTVLETSVIYGEWKPDYSRLDY